MQNTPVVFFIFNRPNTTRIVFNRLAEAQPKNLLIVADGPRNESEFEICQITRSIVKDINWDCNVQRNYSEINMGCKERISSGLDWVFSKFERAIILEDDCLPDLSFFRFCEVLLDKYQDDPGIMMIGGNNFQFGKNKTPYSYYYSIYPHIWGWATWRRAWSHYDVNMTSWPQQKCTDFLLKLLNDPVAIRYWEGIFDLTFEKKIDTWDYQWTYACWCNHGLSVTPCCNLVSNIGFGLGATHTIDHTNRANLPSGTMKFPLKVPKEILPNNSADRYTTNTVFLNRSFKGEIKKKLSMPLRLVKTIMNWIKQTF
jgi:hypothetical protein